MNFLLHLQWCLLVNNLPTIMQLSLQLFYFLFFKLVTHRGNILNDTVRIKKDYQVFPKLCHTRRREDMKRGSLQNPYTGTVGEVPRTMGSVGKVVAYI